MTAWLIERPGEHGPEWMADSIYLEWTTDPQRAFKYATKEGAEEDMRQLPDAEHLGVRVTEHEWVPPSADKEAT